MAGFPVQDGGQLWGPSVLTQPLLMDRRECVMQELDTGGGGCTGHGRVARREGVRAQAGQGQRPPGKIGGHVPPGIPGADRLRAWMAEAAFTLHRLMAEPAGPGPKADRRKMWAFAHAEGPKFR